MKCNDMEFLISLHIDNKLDGAELEKLLKHFEECSSCRQTYKDLLRIKELLGSQKEILLPDSFENKIMKMLKNKENISPAGFLNTVPKRKLLMLAAGFLFIVLSSVTYFSTHKKKVYDFGWYYETAVENTEDSSYGTSDSKSENFFLTVY